MVTIDDDDDDGSERMRKRQKRGAAQALQLCADILIQILTRLRIKSLMRFKLACKSWMALISNPIFVDSLKHRSSKSDEIITMKLVENDSVVVLMDGKGTHKSCFPLLWKEDPNFKFLYVPTIVHCDGLFLIARSAQPLTVCNPATRESVALPPTTYVPNLRISGVGIGLDRSANEYKVVRVFYRRLENNFYREEDVCGIEVITLGAPGNSWRLKAHDLPFDISYDLKVVTVQGAVYWKVFKKRTHNSGVSHLAIVRFDLSNEEFTVIDPPIKYVCLVELQGNLCCFARSERGSQICLWLLNVDNNLVGWTLLYTIHLQVPNLQLDHFMPIAIDQEGCLLFKLRLRMHRYNPQTNQYDKMGSDAYAREIRNSCCCHTTSYVETIRPICSNQW